MSVLFRAQIGAKVTSQYKFTRHQLLSYLVLCCYAVTMGTTQMMPPQMPPLVDPQVMMMQASYSYTTTSQLVSTHYQKYLPSKMSPLSGLYYITFNVRRKAECSRICSGFTVCWMYGVATNGTSGTTECIIGGVSTNLIEQELVPLEDSVRFFRKTEPGFKWAHMEATHDRCINGYDIYRTSSTSLELCVNKCLDYTSYGLLNSCKSVEFNNGTSACHCSRHSSGDVNQDDIRQECLGQVGWVLVDLIPE